MKNSDPYKECIILAYNHLIWGAQPVKRTSKSILCRSKERKKDGKTFLCTFDASNDPVIT